jgi:DedD protein
VGACVLIALAVIFLPSFFQKAERVEIDTRSQIPTSPSIEPIVINKPTKPESIVVPKASELFQPAPQQLSQNVNNTENTASVVEEPKSATEPSANGVSQGPEIDAKLNSQGVPVGWVLQVGSFKSKESAEKFVETLTKANDQAYFKSANTSQGQFYRVYIGPIIDKNQAMARQQEIDKIHKVKSQLLRFNSLSGN